MSRNVRQGRHGMKEEDGLAKRVLDEAFRLHSELGPGLLESVYEQVLAARLRKAGLQIETQKSISIVVDDLRILGSASAVRS